jgi:hypothetical protein
MITDRMIRAAAQLLHDELSKRVTQARRKSWQDLKPSTRKQYLDLSHALLEAAGKAARKQI